MCSPLCVMKQGDNIPDLNFDHEWHAVMLDTPELPHSLVDRALEVHGGL